MGWTLVADLKTLMAEFNTLAPGRDHASDGTIGDKAHQKEKSDHNPDDTPGVATPYTDADTIPEVHAIDVDDDLRKPGWSMQRAVNIIVGRHKSGKDNRLQNIIYNRTIWSRSWGWTPRPYTGPSPHTEHAHFSSRYGSGTTGNPEADTRPWGLLEADDMTEDEMYELLESERGQDALNMIWQRGLNKSGSITPSVALQDVVALENKVEALDSKVDQILTAVTRNAVPN